MDSTIMAIVIDMFVSELTVCEEKLDDCFD